MSWLSTIFIKSVSYSLEFTDIIIIQQTFITFSMIIYFQLYDFKHETKASRSYTTDVIEVNGHGIRNNSTVVVLV